jgi:hypothetical protein
MDKAFGATGTAACAGTLADRLWDTGFLAHSWLLDDPIGYFSRCFGYSSSCALFDDALKKPQMTNRQSAGP